MSELRPALPSRLTSATLHQPIDQPSSQPDDPSVLLSEHTPGLLCFIHIEPMLISFTPKGEDGEETMHRRGSGPSIQDILSLAAIIIMLAWPWAFFGAVWIRGGVQLSNHMAKVVMNNPHATTYFVTLICSIISMITGALFSLAIIRFAQELVTHRKPTRPFHLRVLLSFRRQTWPWGMSVKGAKYLIHRNRWWPAVLLMVCIFTFPHLISSTASLLAPITFNRTADLTGTEIDFSGGVNCQSWFNNNPLPDNCDYKLYYNLPYTTCLGENQMVDVLESGRGNILELLTNNTQSLTFSQLGGDGGLHFLGSIRGVLPIGPNGVPEFNTLKHSPFSDPKIMAGMVSYDYTLKQQGLTSNVSCVFSSTNAFKLSPLDLVNGSTTHTLAIGYNIPCGDLPGGGEGEVFTDVVAFRSTRGNNTLVYWACQSILNGIPTDSYSIYLAGYGLSYPHEFGNITCSVNPIQTAIFPVTYHSTTNIFSTAQPNLESSQAITSPNLLAYALAGLGGVISQGQNFEANLVAESVLTFAYKSFDLSVDSASQSPTYLRLFEQIIQGIIEYEVTYLRLIYSTLGGRPPECDRTVTGSVNYQVVGWFVSRANVGFLIPVTIINGAAFVALVTAMWMAWTGGHIFHPFHPRPVTIAEHVDEQEQIPNEWRDKVTYDPTTVLKDYFRKDVVGNLKKDIQAVKHEVERVEKEFVPVPSDMQQEDIAPADDRSQQDIAPADDRLQENAAR